MKYARIPLDTLQAYEKSGINSYHGFSERCCPVCRYDGLYETDPKMKGALHKPNCWLGKAIAEASEE